MILGGGDLTEYTTLSINDSFEKKGTKVKLTPNAQKGKFLHAFPFGDILLSVDNSMSDKERANVLQTVQEDRKYWLQAAISRIMKRIRQEVETRSRLFVSVSTDSDN